MSIHVGRPNGHPNEETEAEDEVSGEALCKPPCMELLFCINSSSERVVLSIPQILLESSSVSPLLSLKPCLLIYQPSGNNSSPAMVHTKIDKANSRPPVSR